ncbi:MAG: preprotein translocase subunit YajC [Clostridiales Family XIII bacterium]|nr:preprotein translocase subunit YajC [Clostridiales Family XIII bacterium]
MSSQLIQFLPIIAVFLLLWLLLIRPQRKKDKQVKEMRESLLVGNKITTIGGIKGTIVKIKGDTITIAVGSDKVKMDFERWAISRVDDADAQKAKAAPAPKEKEEEAPKKPKKLGGAKKDAAEELEEELGLAGIEDVDFADLEEEVFEQEEAIEDEEAK